MEKVFIQDLEIEITKKNIKNINLSIHGPNGVVKLSAPIHIDDEVIRKFIISRTPWIKKQKLRFESKEVNIDKVYTSGELHPYFGQDYPLKVIYQSSNRKKAEIHNNSIIMYVPEGCTVEKKEFVMQEWYRKQLKDAIPPVIEKYERIMGVNVESWGIKKMKTRWGTCNTKDKRVWINLELAKKLPQCLDYIVVHEMAHLIERGHGDRFKVIMDKYYSNWRSVKAELNGMIHKELLEREVL